MQIGEKIRILRMEKQLTQEELANRCELSKGFISQVENDLTSPSIATLIDILEILGTNLPDFFSDTKEEKVTYSKDDMFETEDSELKYSLKWLIPNAQKNAMEPIMITIEAGGQYIEEEPHEGEEFGLPKKIIFLNSGVKLLSEDSKVIEGIRLLIEKGVKIYSSSMCIDHYDLRSKVLVGTKIDMSEIVDIMNEADQLIKI